MVRYAGDRDVEAGRDLTDRQVTLRIEELEDPESCRVGSLARSDALRWVASSCDISQSQQVVVIN
jgi:hypothetical protein